MIKSILVPIDYSAASLKALESAIYIASLNNANLKILYVAETDWTSHAFNQLEHVKQLADAMQVNIQAKHGVESEIIFGKGFVGSAIISTSIEKKTDLIIMGTHGASGMRELFIGSNSYYVMKHANPPVLIIPEGRLHQHFKNILLPFRTSFGAFKRSEFINALSGGGHTGVEVLALSVDKDSIAAYVSELMSSNSTNMQENKRIKLSIRSTNEKNISREVLERLERMQADLVILSPALDVITKHVLIGPFCQRIINHAKIPVLYMH